MADVVAAWIDRDRSVDGRSRVSQSGKVGHRSWINQEKGENRMLHIRNLEEGVELFKVLGSDIRVNIILLL